MRSNFLVTNIDKGERGKCFNNCDEGCGCVILVNINNSYFCKISTKYLFFLALLLVLGINSVNKF